MHLEDNPTEADKLIVPAMRHLELPRTHLGLVRHYVWILNWVLERVHALQRPVALPGFLNTPHCVSIFDSRGLLPSSPRMRIRFDEEDETKVDPICWLHPESDVGVEIRLVPNPSDRDAVVRELNLRYEELGALQLIDVPDGSRVVDGIAWNRIDLVRPTEKTRIGSMTIDTKEDPSAEEAAFSKIGADVAGVVAMRDGLRAEIGAFHERHARWGTVAFDDGSGTDV